MNLQIRVTGMFRNKTERVEAFYFNYTGTKSIELNKNFLILQQTSMNSIKEMNSEGSTYKY